MAKRLIEFLRSVLPADPYQLLYLAGIVCLLTAHGLKWRPSTAHIDWIRLSGPLGPYIWESGVVAHLLIVFAAMVAYFICFWPGNHPVRRISGFVVFPAVIGLLLTLGRYLYLGGPLSTILQSSASNALGKISWVLNIFWQSPGATVTFSGLLLIVLFEFRLALGISTLPLALSGVRSELSNHCEGWRRLQYLIWFLVALTPLFVALLLFVPLPVFLPWVRTNGFSHAAINFGAVVVYVVAGLIVGREGRKTIRKYFAKPSLKWVAFAVLLPIGVEALLALGQVAADHLQRTIRYTDFVPVHESPLPTLVISFFVLLVPAFVEEAIFRGLLQARFVLRYGLYRGIFLVNIVWGASHFYSDFSFTHKPYLQAADQLAVRIFVALAVGFVLS